MKTFFRSVLIAIAFFAANLTLAQNQIVSRIAQIDLKRHSDDETAISVAWSPSEDYLAVGGIAGVYLYDEHFDFFKLLQFTEQQPYIISVKWHPSGELLAAASMSGSVYLWDVHQEKLLDLWTPFTTTQADMDWSDDGQFIAASSWSGEVRVYDVENKEGLPQFGEQTWGTALALDWQPGSETLTFYGEQAIRFWNITQEQPFYDINPDYNSIPRWSTDGNYLALSGFVPGSFRGDKFDIPDQWVIYILNSQREFLRTLFIDDYTKADVYAFAWHPESDYLAALSYDAFFGSGSGIRIWRISDGAEIAQINGETRIADIPSYNSLAWSPDGQFLADAGSDGVVSIWRFTP